MARHAAGIKSLVGLPDDQQLTLTDVAAVLNMHYSTAYELVVGGAMPFIRHGRQSIRVEVGALREYIAHRRVASRKPNDFITVKKAV